jgi:4-hydroxybenzoate polyprenyltransferase
VSLGVFVRRFIGKTFESAVYNIYATLNISGVLIGFILSNVILNLFAAIFILIAATLISTRQV